MRRSGATLTEVLMAILILGVGVVSVFTLFPISILRAIQATQNTNAKILKYQAEELVRATPIVLDVNAPPAGFPSPGSGASPAEFRGAWRPNTDYTVGDMVVPSVKAGSSFPAPHRWFQCVSASGDPASSAMIEPIWNLSGTTLDLNEDLNVNGTLDPGEDQNGNGRLDQLAWSPVAAVQIDATTGQPSSSGPVVPTSRYVVDPLGWTLAAAEGSFPVNEFGNKTDATTGIGATVWDSSIGIATAPLLRINGGTTSTLTAALGTTLPDSWEQVLEATPESTFNIDSGSSPAGPGMVTFPANVDLSNIAFVPVGRSRITLTSTDGTHTFTRDITGVSGNQIAWSGQHPAPASFPVISAGPPAELDVGLARVETFDRRYSWMLTVKKDASGRAEIKVVVFFKRALTAADEHVYDSNFGNVAADLDGDGTADGTQHGLGTRSDWVKIVWTSAEPEPLTKPGNLLFDARDCEWYRIREVQDRSTTSAVLLLDRTVKTLTTDDGSGPPPAVTPAGRAILMRGIVDVYEL